MEEDQSDIVSPVSDSFQSQVGVELTSMERYQDITGRTSSLPARPMFRNGGFNPMYSQASDLTGGCVSLATSRGMQQDDELVIGAPVLTQRGTTGVEFNVGDNGGEVRRPLSDNFLNNTRSRIVSINSRRYEGSKIQVRIK